MIITRMTIVKLQCVAVVGIAIQNCYSLHTPVESCSPMEDRLYRTSRRLNVHVADLCGARRRQIYDWRIINLRVYSNKLLNLYSTSDVH